MKKLLGSMAVALVALAGFAMPASAQMVGNPVYVSPKHGTGLSIAADYGRGLNLDSGKPNYFGGRATLGLPMLSISAGAGSVKPTGGTSNISFGGNVAVNLIKAPVMPVALSVFAGAGYLKSGSGATAVKNLNVPAGVALAFDVPSPSLSVEPWVAPRVQLAQTKFGGASVSQIGFGASAGVNVGLPMGVGFHAALEYMTYAAKTSGTLTAAKVSPFMIGLGAHYKFNIPGLGMAGM